MLDTIHVETDGGSGLARTQSWLSRHRGQSVQLDRTRLLELGVPISGAGAVLVAVTVRDGDPATTQLGGVVRAIASRTGRDAVRLIFDGRSPAHLELDRAESVATKILSAISRLVGEDSPDQAVA